jgi:hypothetical protein
MTRTKMTEALAAVAMVLLLATAAIAQTAAPPGTPAPAPSREQGQPALPVIGTILEHRGALELSASQVEALERLGLDFIREAIRRQADLLITQIDLDVLLDQDPSKTVDMKAAEAKLREIEKIRADLQLALIRAVEAARAQLTSEQRSKLAAFLAGTAAQSDADPADDPPIPARGAGPAAPGGSGRPAPGGAGRPAPSGPGHPAPGHPAPGRPAPGAPGRPAPGGPGHPGPGGGVAHPRPPERRFEAHRDAGRRDHVFIRGWSSFWWEPYWFYAPPPVIVQEPPVYVQPSEPLYWYYCQSAQAYYPYVSSCPEPWIAVQATPQ